MPLPWPGGLTPNFQEAEVVYHKVALKTGEDYQAGEPVKIGTAPSVTGCNTASDNPDFIMAADYTQGASEAGYGLAIRADDPNIVWAAQLDATLSPASIDALVESEVELTFSASGQTKIDHDGTANTHARIMGIHPKHKFDTGADYYYVLFRFVDLGRFG